MPVTKLPKNTLVEAIRGAAQQTPQPTDDNTLKAQLLGFLGNILENQPRAGAEQSSPMLGVMRPVASHPRQEPGNIDLYNRPEIPNNGGISTVYSMSFMDEDPRSRTYGSEVLVPLADGGRILTPQEAIQRYYQTGRHLGAFAAPDDATTYAQQLHKDYEEGRYRMRPATTVRQLLDSIDSMSGPTRARSK